MTTIFRSLLALILFLGASLVSCASEPVHLILLSGQSNMANLKPELVFTPEIHKHFGADQVVIVKVAQKSQPIRRWYKQWTVTGDQNPAQIGDIYEQLMQQAKTALNGRPIKSVTLIWMQGERDAKESLSAHYEEAFLGLLAQIKTDLAVPKIHYIIGRLSDSGLGSKEWDNIRAIQQKLGEAGPHSAWINTDDLNDEGTPSGKNDLHYSKKGYDMLAERYAHKVKELLSAAHSAAQK